MSRYRSASRIQQSLFDENKRLVELANALHNLAEGIDYLLSELIENENDEKRVAFWQDKLFKLWSIQAGRTPKHSK